MSTIIYTFLLSFLILIIHAVCTFIIRCMHNYLCIMCYAYCILLFCRWFMLYVVFDYEIFCIMYTRCNEQRGRGVVLCAMYEGRGRGGIEVGVRRRYPTFTPRAIFNSPGPSTLLTTHPTMWHNTITPISSFRVGI